MSRPVPESNPIGPRRPVAGRPRNVLVCLVLGLVTFGLYFVFWHYAAFEETRLHSRTRHRLELFWAWLIVGVFAIVWAVAEAGGVPRDPAASPVTLTLQAASWAFLVAYLFIETRHVRTLARDAGVPSMAWPTGFILMGVLYVLSLATDGTPSKLASVVSAIVALMAYPFVQMTLNDFWRRAGWKPG